MYRKLKILERFLVSLFQAAKAWKMSTDVIHADLFYLAWRAFPSPKIKNAGLGHHFYIVPPFNSVIFTYSLTVSFQTLCDLTV